jgi:uracil-DNA glycosylase
MPNRDKERRLKALAQNRRSDVPKGYRCVSSFWNGKYDSDFVVPWTKSACNADADLMIIAQDWASKNKLKRAFNQEMADLGYDPRLETNKGLFECLDKYMHLKFGETYATNVFPFIKPGRMSAQIPRNDLKRAATDYALPQIKIVSPRMVICLGIGTFNAIFAALAENNGRGKTRRLSWGDYERMHSVTKYGQTEIYAVTHLGNLGKIRRRDKIGSEWKKLARRLHELQTR